jgi:hypothetical protein
MTRQTSVNQKSKAQNNNKNFIIHLMYIVTMKETKAHFVVCV